MKLKFSTKSLCRAGIIGALYIALTASLGEIAFGPFQIRPAEALCMLPLFYIEAIPGLYAGCMLANFISSYGVYDIFLGSLATLLSSVLTYAAGRVIRNKIAAAAVGGLFPVLFNAFLVPAVWILAGSPSATYWANFASMLLTESVWIYALGVPLYISVDKMIARGVRVLQPERLLIKVHRTDERR